MKTLRWDLFYEIQHMETVADERTARLEARRNKWLLRTYPWLLLVIYLFAGTFVGRWHTAPASAGAVFAGALQHASVPAGRHPLHRRGP